MSSAAVSLDPPGSDDRAAGPVVVDGDADWRVACARYRTPSDAIAGRKLALNLSLLALTWAAMIAALAHGADLLVVPLGVVAGLVFNQLFLFQHDMGHGAFFASRRANEIAGTLVCVLMLTPFLEWTRSHAFHHRNVARLDRRVLGDIYTMTVREWHAAGPWKRLGYRLFRHPFTLLFIVPVYYFFVANRIKGSVCPGMPRGRNLWNVWLTTFAFAAFAITASRFVGWRAFVLVEMATLVPGGAVGLWIFYMGHNFEHTWYATSPSTWTYREAALRGASFCVMPRFLGWLLADIGYHHVHHLDPRIPSYRLRACHEENPQLFGGVKPLSLAASVRGLLRGRLYDEERAALVGFDDVDVAAARVVA